MLLIYTLHFTLYTSLAWAGKSQVGTSAANFLKIHPGARQAALVGSFEGLADDAYALYYNPAGLVKIQDGQFAANHTDYFESINFDYVAAAISLTRNSQERPRQALGFSITGLSVEDIPKRSGDQDTPEGTFSAGDTAYQLSYARAVLRGGNHGDLSLGVSAKYLKSRIESWDADAAAADLGLLWQPQNNRHVMGVGMVVRNLGSEMKFKEESDPLPFIVSAGAALQWFKGRLTVLPGVHVPRDNDPYFSLGAEGRFAVAKDLEAALRSGYTSWKTGSGGTRQIGVGLGLSIRQFSFDFAWIPYGDLGNTFRYSILARF